MCARISYVEMQYSQLKINHLNDTPSTKAAGGGIYSGVLLKDVKVPVKVRRTLSSAGTSSSNKDDIASWRVFTTPMCMPIVWTGHFNSCMFVINY